MTLADALYVVGSFTQTGAIFTTSGTGNGKQPFHEEYDGCGFAVAGDELVIPCV